MDYWKPRNRTQLNQWLEKQYPGHSFRRLPQNQAWVIFFKTIRKHEQGAVNGNV